MKIYEAVTNSNPIAIIVRCPDRRFRRAHNQLIREDLALNGEDFIPLKPAGGAGSLARQKEMDSDFKSLDSQIGMFAKHSPDLKHLIAINHQDCKRYNEMMDRAEIGEHAEREDLYAVIEYLSQRYPQLTIGAYYAYFVDEQQTQIAFEVIRRSPLQIGEI